MEIIAKKGDWNADLRNLSVEAKKMIREESRAFRRRVTVRLAASIPEPDFRPVFFFGKTSKLKYVMLLFRIHRSELPGTGILGYSLVEAKELSKLELEGDGFDDLIGTARSRCDATLTLYEAVEQALALAPDC